MLQLKAGVAAVKVMGVVAEAAKVERTTHLRVLAAAAMLGGRGSRQHVGVTGETRTRQPCTS